MYNDSNSAFIAERYQSSKMLKEVSDEKEKIEKKHACILEDAHKWMDATERKLQVEHIDRMNREKEDAGEVEKYVQGLKHDVEVLKKAKEEMKNLVRTQADVFKVKKNKLVADRDALLEEKKKWQSDMVAMLEEKKKLESVIDVLLEEKKNWEDARVAMKQENKKMEYNMYDLFVATNAQKQKLKKIKEICDE